MAIDGSFKPESELRRFIYRCPKLASVPIFSSLLNKGDKVTEEEVVNAVGELFLHPNYTIPLIGCFRPIAKKIVDRAVGLLRMLPDLRSNSDDSIVEFDEDKFLREDEDEDTTQVVSLIDVYVKSGKRLNLHEVACLALCRALDLIPLLLGSVLGYFEFAPPPFEKIKLRESVAEAFSMAGSRLLNVVRASYRFLLAAPEVFSTLWDWSCLLDLVEQLANLDVGDDAKFLMDFNDLRWCAIQILLRVLKLSDRAFEKFGFDSEEAFKCLSRWQVFCQDISLEKAGWYLEPSAGEKSDLVGGASNLCQGRHLQSCTLGSLHNRTLLLSSTIFQLSGCTGRPFVLTSAVTKSYEMVYLAVSQRWPVLLYGPAGAGKTALLRNLAQNYGSKVLCIHMDEQIDGKTLLGSYVCTEKPGEFRWQPGSLTQAVCDGFWVVFEDIDKAPPDIQSILLPLLEGATLFSTGYGEAIRVSEGFRLFSTVTSSKLDVPHATEGRNSLGARWRRVVIGSSSTEDLLTIVHEWYHRLKGEEKLVECNHPGLDLLAEKLIETFDRVNKLAGPQFGATAASSSFNSRFSLRDILKWCKRIVGLGFCFERDALTMYMRDSIYKEAVDVFAAFSTKVDNRLAIMKEIAEIWTVSAPGTLYPVNKPIIQELRADLRIGRITLQRTQMASSPEKKPFVEIHSSVHILERIACSVKHNEPVLLVGETGTGKTTLVQNLAMRLGQKLTVLNLSQQSDPADLLGGFKPINAQFVCIPLYKEFENLFNSTFSSKDNEKFLIHLRKSVAYKNWKQLIDHCQKVLRKVADIRRYGSGKKRKRSLGPELWEAWDKFSMKLERVRAQISASSGMVFSFVEGAFITALKNGEWILLDEVNLAPPETLQRIIGVLEEENGSLCLAERGDVDYISRDTNFRIFACMNPATDAGKRDLPSSLRGRFTEYFVDDVLNDEDLIMFINQFMNDDHSNRELVNKIMHFYRAAKKAAEERLQDGANMKPQYSLRSLYRALEYTRKARRKFGFEKALYDGFCMFFRTLLDEPSAKFMNQLISSYLLGGEIPQQIPFDAYLMVNGNSAADDFLENYVLTKSVKEHLRNLARAIFVCRYPVLLQGPTSSGKTSLVQYLAAITGHEFVRINNHEHTDLQEYLGSYITDASGKLVFLDGALVRAVRNGHWIVLDELNLAPSDVLEALNRLLDDNRELFIPELNETVRAHPEFMLFATQNPPTSYGGRKILSRAFRNRFVEIQVEEIPQDELSTILEKRCKIPQTYARKMVEVMKELQLHRQSSKIFAGKHGFITPRDLFRWANRFRIYGKSYEDLARDGYYLMAERLRDDNEKRVVQEVLERQLRVKLAMDGMYKKEGGGGVEVGEYYDMSQDLGKIIWTKSMWRLYFLVERCYNLREPVLLVGETGGGKTTVCQMLSCYLGSKLHILNCHQYTETSDFLGGFYPLRDRSYISSDFEQLCWKLMSSKALIHFPGDATISSDITQASLTIEKLSVVINSYRQGRVFHPDVTVEEINCIEQLSRDLDQLHQKWQTIFAWQDGPLVEAMKKGDLILVDEISLADDSVLERLNSVLEPERKLSLAEKGGSDLERITAHPNFFILATMNPGGDYGKKELSPALRNRFTEIWVPSVVDVNELKSIAVERISNPQLKGIVDVLLNFWEWFNQLQTGRMLTVRDLLSWVSFMNVAERTLQPESAFLHGAFLVLLDGLSLGTTLSSRDATELREKCLSFLLQQLKEYQPISDYVGLSSLESFGWADPGRSAVISYPESLQSGDLFGIHPFYIEKGPFISDAKGFEFLAPTTRRNALRVLRAMQLAKPVLLEGSPGVGKTSLIVALGKYSGHTVVRINLSEQTDMMDLLGSDLPVESDDGVLFAWSDGILLQAIKNGSWVLLDELNLAPQSVLEGLNAILDHRAEVFIPELGRSYKCPTSFRVFACQNPSSQGGGRKGLPKSFLNRFTKVYVDELVEDDYLSICRSLYPSISETILSKLVLFNKRLYEDTMLHHKFAQEGSPWEFNLRDVIRSCEIIQGSPDISKSDCFLNTVYVQRMRTSADRQEVIRLYEQVFGSKPLINPHPRVQLNLRNLIVGNVSVTRNSSNAFGRSVAELKILPGLRHSLEAVACCLKHKWLCILVGPTSSGKTSLIRLLAQLTGNVLNELNLSSATDISELLGSFEQYNAFRNYRLAIATVERYINQYYSLKFEISAEEFIRKKELISLWFSFLSSIDFNSPTMTTSTSVETWRTRYFDFIPKLVEIIELLSSNLENNILPVSWSRKDLDEIVKVLKKLEEDHRKRRYSRKFEWVAGLLIKAIENGEWIVLENANLCNPTVLDRINSLVEQSGSITVNECGLVDGEPVVLHPHPQFRMFLTINPAYGEVSRAMRNRGVEIYIMQPYWQLDEKCSQHLDENELEDVKRFIILCGIPIGRLVDKMAEAHIYAKHEGARLDVSITYLELTRWVQLFQRLVTNGNQPIWSLQISWEHTYLSSLGEGEGKEIVSRAICSYLSMHEVSSFNSCHDCLLSLPGGWPNPLILRDFVCYSKETSVRQNCLYLESLATLCASSSFNNDVNRYLTGKGLIASVSAGICVMDSRILCDLMFPEDKNYLPATFDGQKGLDTALAQKMLLFAANWTIEQSMESDFKLYLLWFKNFGSQLGQSCSFFHQFLDIMEKEVKHPIWNQILHCRRKLIAYTAVELDLTPIPILSMDMIDLAVSADMSNSCSLLLMNSIKSERLLRRSYHQWVLEKEYDYDKKSQCFKPVLKSLRRVEKKVLELFVSSTSFDVLFQLYSDLLEHHTLLWKGITSSWFECLIVSLRALVKDSVKLYAFCPGEVDNFQQEIKNFNGISCWSFHSQKSLLWAYGGHPFLPSSADLYQKYTQLLEFCELVWPRNAKLGELTGSDSPIKGVLTFNPELNVLAMQGVCMSSYIMGKKHDINVVEQLDEMYQMLKKRFHFEEHRLENLQSTDEDDMLPDFSACCSFSPDMLCRRSGYHSWLETLPLIDSTSFLLDAQLLEGLSMITLLDVKEQHHALSGLSALLESAMRFSLNLSSRPPTDFSPHQKILWTLDAWGAVHTEDAKISSFVLEMWLRWHKSLWVPCPVSSGKTSARDILLPDWLFQPVKMAAVDQILQCTIAVREYPVHSLKFRVASRNLWQACPSITNVYGFLLSAALTIFQNIIHAHQRSFSDEKYAEIKSIFHLSLGRKITQDDINHLVSLLASSNHHAFTSLLDAYIEPLLGKLYCECLSNDSICSVGCAWLWIGCLHYHLLVCCDDVDPAVKYSIKYSHLMEKIASLELENEVREACVRLSGCFRLTESGRHQKKLVEDLHAEAKKLQRKVVFRSDPGKFRKLKHECDEFLKWVTTFATWSKNLESMHVADSSGMVRNWQETVASFIEQLSIEYPSYSDIVEPVQVALYEIKLGLSLIHSSALSKELLQKVGQPDMESVLATVYSFMRFPRGCPSKAVSLKESISCAKLYSADIEMPTYIGVDDLKMMETLVTFRQDVNADGTASSLQLKTLLFKNVLLKVMHYIAGGRFMDNTSFLLLDKIFDEFGGCWMDMKLQLKTKEENETQQFKFRPYAFRLENIIEIDISSLKNTIANESLLEWQELLAEEGFSEKMSSKDAHETLEEDWSFLEESLLRDMVDIHNQLFGTIDIDLHLGRVHISDADKISNFTDSYTLGARIIRDLEGILMSGFDASIVPEHLLRICLEHEQKFNFPHKSAHAYNFYKDSNAPFMAKMVKPLENLKQRILVLLNEWDGHNALQRIVDVIDMVLVMPLSTPLAKALSGLEFLLNRVQMLQETVAKFPLSDHLEPIFALVSSWHKLEFESWAALLDEVEAQFNTNAGKLWFPLYSVLQRRDSDDTVEYNQSTIQSLEEFIRMSSIGEFRKRLQILLAFHGHISNSLFRGCNSFPRQEENEKILYNTFGFYVQFLPIISGHIGASRGSIEKELKELVKLCRWERIDNYLAVESLRRTRLKLKKIIHKYTDLLNQPVILFLNKEPAHRGIHIQAVRGSDLQVDSFEKNKSLLDVVCHQTKIQESDRLPWFTDWQKKMEFVQQHLQLDNAIQNNTGVATIIEDSVPPISSCLLGRRKHVWDTVGRICRTVTDCGELWKDESKKLGKRRVFSDLLKLLGSCGLTKHRSTSMESNLKTNQSSFWLLQPSYNVEHLLLAPDVNSSKNTGNPALSSHQDPSHGRLETEWISANQYYFRSIASVHVLQQVSLNFHKDFTLEQVQRSVSYLDHLMEIQQEQRAAAYDFAKQLKRLKECMWPLANLFSGSCTTSSECCYTQNQHLTFRCMWQQKQLFDSLCTMLDDERLLLQRVEDNHFTTCPNVKDAAKNIRLFLEKFVPDFQKSKDLLDNHLLGHNRVVVTVEAVLPPHGVTKQMELLVSQNFQLLSAFEDSIRTFQRKEVNDGAVESMLFGHYDDIFKKANSIAEEFNSAYPSCHGENTIELEAGFNEALKETYSLIVDTFHTIGSQEHANRFSEESLRNITLWKDLFVSDITQLKLISICDEVEKAIHFAGKLVNSLGDKIPVEAHLRQLYLLLDVILAFGGGLLHDFLVMHRMVSVMTHVLADTFASLFAKGFGVRDDQVAENDHEKTQDASGTGLGEGAGLNDVSDQIEDEDQLLGTSEKPNEEENALTDTPSKNVKGIEMEQDFDADAFSVSEESGDDNADDNEDQQLDSAMGETGANSEIVDEKLWDKEEDENTNSTQEKYESGPSVKDGDVNGRELRAKEDSAAGGDEAEEYNPDTENAEEGNEEGPEGGMDDMNVNKEDVFADPTGLKPDEPNQVAEEDINMDEPEGAEPMEDGGPEGPEAMEDGEAEGTEPMEDDLLSADNERLEQDKSNSVDDTSDEVAENSEMGNLESDQGNNPEKDLMKPKKDAMQMGNSNFAAEDVQKAHQSGTEPKGDSDAPGFQDVAPEAMHSESGDSKNDLAPMSGVPNASAVETAVADLCRGKKITSNQPGNPLPPSDSFLPKMQPNPCRNVGDALEGWKDRVKVSFDLPENSMQDLDDMVDENADEFGYTAEFEKGTAQALGPATTDQMDSNIKGNDLDRDTGTISREDDVAEVEIETQPSETHPVRSSTLNLGNHMEELLEKSDLEREPDGPSEVHSKQYSDLTSLPESMVSMKRSYLDEDVQFNKLSVSDDDDLGKANTSGVFDNMREDAAALWRRYELSTTRLSQELAEQLRLVMEPTLANKLQGNYKTGKRINMKKVIPYIASHYRKDKIWLRRTRPNKRDYQVVIAVDDSRSMLESCCGDVAIEALVAVCRAMSQLEVGNLAVTSFGKEGNVRLLHDFDQPFTGEAGIKMISSLTFKQENTFKTKPMADLLKYLNNMLDMAVVNARLPSGHNPLQQLVLIIADGRFHEEKENLRRYVRDILSKKRMVAFLLLDSQQESIMDLMEVTSKDVKISKYLDSFPFPYYLVLRNIESLPRALADLLKQWFELMQYSRD